MVADRGGRPPDPALRSRAKQALAMSSILAWERPIERRMSARSVGWPRKAIRAKMRAW